MLDGSANTAVLTYNDSNVESNTGGGYVFYRSLGALIRTTFLSKNSRVACYGAVELVLLSFSGLFPQRSQRSTSRRFESYSNPHTHSHRLYILNSTSTIGTDRITTK